METGVKTFKFQNKNDCFRDLKPLEIIGKGEFGETWSLEDNNQMVIKKIKIQNTTEKTNFFYETEIQKELGYLNIAPKIYDYWICEVNDELYGFILMEKLQIIYRDLFPDRYDPYIEYPKSKLPSQDIQKAIIGGLEKMIENGYIHNDNHGGNIGISVDGKLKIFDFGFTRKVISRCMHCNKEQLLGFALYQLIEHLPFEIRNDTLYYDIIYEIRQSIYEFGTYIHSFEEYTYRKRKSISRSSARTRKTIKKGGKRNKKSRKCRKNRKSKISRKNRK